MCVKYAITDIYIFCSMVQRMYEKSSAFIFFLLLIIFSPCSAQCLRVDLAGTWKLSLDSIRFEHQITFPGSTDEIPLGERHKPGTDLYIGKPETWQLARKYTFIGPVWYYKEINITQEWTDKRIILSLERCMWQTKVWINGDYVGEEHSLCTPHKYDVTRYIMKGLNKICLRIDNSPYVHLGSWSHGYSPGIQTIWNGVIGSLFLEAKDKVSIENLQCYPILKDKTVRWKGELINLSGKSGKGTLRIKITDPKGKVVLREKKKVICQNEKTDISYCLQLNEPVLEWDEYTPHLYQLEVDCHFDTYKGTEQVSFGFRDISTENGKLKLNGRTLFLRGEHDPGSFPLTGYPSMEKKDWIRIFRIGKEYGMNHWRFHSWCPPEAAFAAADEVGVYLQPELTLFSQNWEHTLVGQDTARDQFLFSELRRLLDTYGNHPSFLLMCMGNELRGDASVLEKWVEYGKRHDNRHLYAGSANLEAMGKYLPLSGDQFQVAHAAKVNGKRFERRMGGYFNSEYPNTINDYSHTLVPPYNQCPVITHELGQWEIYPDFSEIKKYTGVLTPRNLEVFKNSLEQKGMDDQAPAFLKASGKLASILYKEEIERVLRTPGMSGFQLLDLRDYPAQGSALVGLLNVFWDSKGLISPEEFRQSCNDVTVLLKMPKRTWTNNEIFDGEIVIPNYSRHSLENTHIEWEVLYDGKPIYKDSLHIGRLPQGEVHPCGKITFPLEDFTEATKLKVVLSVSPLGIRNQYSIWVYPKSVPINRGRVIVADKATPKLLEQIENGASVLLVPKDVEDVERMTFSNPFWSTILFDYQPKSMGLYCNPEHPIFKNFPTDMHTNWQWWELTVSASVARINGTPSSYRPILQVIDHPVRNDKLGAIMETRIGKGKLLVCMLDILSNLETRPVARQLKYSILNYMNSSAFQPQEVPGLKACFFADEVNKTSYRAVRLPGESKQHPAINMVDGSSDTFCELPANSGKVIVELELNEERYIVGCRLPTTVKGLNKFKVYVTTDKDNLGEAVIHGTGNAADYHAGIWDNGFTIQKGKKGKYVFLEIDKTPGRCICINEIELMFGD